MPVTSLGYFAPTSNIYAESIGIDVPSGTDCLLLFVHQITGTPNATATLGSQSFSTAQDTASFAYGFRSCRLLRLDSPTIGSGTVSLSGTAIRGFGIVALDGVDLTNLFTTLAATTYTDTSNDTFPVTVSSQADDLTFLFAGVGGSGGTYLGGFAVAEGSTIGVSYEGEPPTPGIGLCMVEEPGAASVTLGIDPINVGGPNQIHVGLIYGAIRASGAPPTETDYTAVYRRAQMAALLGD